MPYIITTMPAGSAAHPERMTRRAVATLDEAREAAQEAVDSAGPIKSRHSWEAICGHIATMGESGGTVGPLPDGTVIEVEHVAYNWVAGVAEDNGAELSEDASCAEILDAFNAETVR